MNIRTYKSAQNNSDKNKSIPSIMDLEKKKKADHLLSNMRKGCVSTYLTKANAHLEHTEAFFLILIISPERELVYLRKQQVQPRFWWLKHAIILSLSFTAVFSTQRIMYVTGGCL